jgi:predicted Zn finger-like uncharacterized protein
MSLQISCPSCQRTLRVPESLLGQAVKCPSCSHTFTAPEHVEDEAPSRRPDSPPPQDKFGDAPVPSKRRPRDEADDEDDYEPPFRGSRRRDEKPGKVQAIAIMTLIGGILATLTGVAFMATIYGLCWPGTYYSLVMGIMAIVKASQLLGDRASSQALPSGIAIMQIVNIVNCDFVNLTLGIINLVFLSDREVKAFFRSPGSDSSRREVAQ